MTITVLDGLVSEWFVKRYGAGELMRQEWDPGTGHVAQVAELEATRTRLRPTGTQGSTTSPARRTGTAPSTKICSGEAPGRANQDHQLRPWAAWRRHPVRAASVIMP